MTAWLWIIGIATVVWPVIVALHLERRIDDRIQTNFTRYGTMHERMDEAVRSEISKLQAIIEQQDALIAALWQKTFGFHGEGAFSGYELPEYLGVKPAWHPFDREWAGPVEYLVRYEPYPWGTHAEELYFSE